VGGFRRALHGFEHGGEGGLVSTVNDLLRWARELDAPSVLPALLVQQLCAFHPLTGGSASPYARGVERARWRGFDTVGHGGLWPGYRTELLRIPEAQLSVVVITNSGAIEPYRLAREIAALALARDARLAPAPAPQGVALSHCAGTWVNLSEPSMFELKADDELAVITQWGTPFALAPQDDGSWLPWRGAYEFRLRPADPERLSVEVGAGRTLDFARLGARVALPAGLAGHYRCEHLGAHWTIETSGETGALQLRVNGPYWCDGGPWQLLGVADDLLEIQGDSYWLRLSMLARVERDPSGAAMALVVDSARVRKLRFVREMAVNQTGPTSAV